MFSGAPVKTCSVCNGTYSDEMRFCPTDGAALNKADQTEPAVDPLIGKVLAERYRVIRKLGEGGMGSVYLAENIHAEMEVALKILSSRASSDPVLLKRFEAERRIISRLRHPNILKLLDSFHTTTGELVVVIEFVNGETLEDRIAKKGLSPRETLYILAEVFDALSEAHDAEVIHRDLKPSNLMIEEVGDRLVVKVLDFGIAKTLSSTGMTNTGMTLGTPAYMSPEQVQGLEIDSRSDLYSMGCVAYECLAGHPPFSGENPFSVIRKHIKEKPPSLTQQVPSLGVESALESFVFALLSKKPEDRPQSARDARDKSRHLWGSTQAKDQSSPRPIPSKNQIVGMAETVASDAIPVATSGLDATGEAQTIGDGDFGPITTLSPDDSIDETPSGEESGSGRIAWFAAAIAVCIAAWVWIFGGAPSTPPMGSKSSVKKVKLVVGGEQVTPATQAADGQDDTQTPKLGTAPIGDITPTTKTPGETKSVRQVSPENERPKKRKRKAKRRQAKKRKAMTRKPKRQAERKAKKRSERTTKETPKAIDSKYQDLFGEE